MASSVSLLHLCLLLLSAATSASESAAEDTTAVRCPAVSCTCHSILRSHVPLVRWHETGESDEDTHHHWNFYHHHESLNHTQDELAATEDDTLVLSAVCVLQSDTDATQLMVQLNPSVQFLSLLQAPDMLPTYLRADDFSRFVALQGLEIQGFHQHDDYITDHLSISELHGNSITALLARADAHRGLRQDAQPQPSLVTLSADALRPLQRLQYVHLDHVLLEPDSAAPRGPQYRSETLPAAGGERDTVHTLLVEQQPDIVPYHEFRLHTAPRYSNFANLTQLRLLRVAHAGLEEITWELFQGLPALQHLIVEHQLLTELPDFAFYGCPNLRRLSLAHNQLTVDMKSFAGLLDLETLDLSHNLISQLTYFSLAPFPQMRELNLLHNPTDLIYPGAFDMMNQTEVLRLGGDGTPLTLMPHALDLLTALRELTIASLHVSVLDGQQFSALTELVSLEIHGQIGRIEFDAFSNNANLERLVVSGCQLHEVSQDALVGLNRLQLLDFSHNQLTELPAQLLNGLPALREVYLHHNQLSWLSPQLLAKVTPKLLQLHHNPWDCNCELAFLSAAVTNKVRSSAATVCRWDESAPGGRLCQHEHRHHLRYDVHVEPRCHTPPQYRNWGLYEVLQRELRCARGAASAAAPVRSPHLHPVSADDPDYSLEVVAADDAALLDERAGDPAQYDDYAEAAADDYADAYDEYSADSVYQDYETGDAPAAEQPAVQWAHGEPTQPEHQQLGIVHVDDDTQEPPTQDLQDVPYVTISPELFARLSRKAQKLELQRMNPKFRKHYNL